MQNLLEVYTQNDPLATQLTLHKKTAAIITYHFYVIATQIPVFAVVVC